MAKINDQALVGTTFPRAPLARAPILNPNPAQSEPEIELKIEYNDKRPLGLFAGSKIIGSLRGASPIKLPPANAPSTGS